MDPFASALEQAAAVRRREVSAGELVDGYLERIERLGPRLNAFSVTTPDLAREQARAAGASSGDGAGPLAGATTSVKDLASMAGYPLTFGSRAFEDQGGQVDAFVGSRIKAARNPIGGRPATPQLRPPPGTRLRPPRPTR